MFPHTRGEDRDCERWRLPRLLAWLSVGVKSSPLQAERVVAVAAVGDDAKAEGARPGCGAGGTQDAMSPSGLAAVTVLAGLIG